eukprot:scaffold7066_cov169-Skeletonema_marinoi.AAC.1
MPHQVTYDVVATRYVQIQLEPVGMAVVSNASSGHLRGYSLADTSKYSLSRDKDASILSWPTLMGH